MTEVSAKKIILKDLSGNYLLPYVEPIPVATQESDGLMSKEDKTKLDNLNQGSGNSSSADINDSVINTNKTWSSSKISEEINKKLSISDIKAGSNVVITENNGKITISATGSGSSSSDVSGIDTSLFNNYYTKSECDENYASKATEHSHQNKTLLDAFTVDVSGVLKYNGKVIPVNPSQLTETVEGNYEEQTEIFNVNTICMENDYKALTNSYVIFKNLNFMSVDLEEDQPDPNNLEISVYSNNLKLDTLIIEPLQTHGYQLPVTTNISIKVKGNVHSELTLVGYSYQ